MKYEYFINLDERGEFFADVRDDKGKTVWELHTNQAQELVEDGYLANVYDLNSIYNYLVHDAGILAPDSELYMGE